MEKGGNQRVNIIFEAKLRVGGGVNKPYSTSSPSDRDIFCRSKYIDRKFYDSSAYNKVLMSIMSSKVGTVPKLPTHSTIDTPKQVVHQMHHQGGGISTRRPRRSSMPLTLSDDPDTSGPGNSQKVIVPTINVEKVSIGDVDFDFHRNKAFHDDWFLNSPERNILSPSLNPFGSCRRLRDDLTTTWHPPSPHFNERTKERIKASNIVTGRSALGNDKGGAGMRTSQQEGTAVPKSGRMNGLTRRLSTSDLFHPGDNHDSPENKGGGGESHRNIEGTIRPTSSSRRTTGLVRQRSSPDLLEVENLDLLVHHNGANDGNHSLMRTNSSRLVVSSRRQGGYHKDSLSCSSHNNSLMATRNSESEPRRGLRNSIDATKARPEMMHSGLIEEHHLGDYNCSAKHELSSSSFASHQDGSHGDIMMKEGSCEERTALKSHANQRMRESADKDTNRRSRTTENSKKESQNGKSERPVAGKEELISELMHCLHTAEVAEPAPPVPQSSKSLSTMEAFGKGDKLNPTSCRQRRNQASLTEQANPRSRSRSRSKSRKSNIPRRKQSDEPTSSGEIESTRRKMVLRAGNTNAESRSPTRTLSNAGAPELPPTDDPVHRDDQPEGGGGSYPDKVARTSRGTTSNRRNNRLSTQTRNRSRSRSKSRDVRGPTRHTNDDPEVTEGDHPERGRPPSDRQSRSSRGISLRRVTRGRDRREAHTTTHISPVRGKSQDAELNRSRDRRASQSTAPTSPVRSKSRDTVQRRFRRISKGSNPSGPIPTASLRGQHRARPEAPGPNNGITDFVGSSLARDTCYDGSVGSKMPVGRLIGSADSTRPKPCEGARHPARRGTNSYEYSISSAGASNVISVDDLAGVPKSYAQSQECR